jgi:predicted SnoaL-like aldol condensation-catalyzing enzyme
MPRKKSNRKKKESSSSRRKRIVRQFFSLIVQGKQMDGLRYFSSNCRQHNPYVQGGMEALLDAMTAAQQEPMKFSDPEFSVKRVIADADMVVVHTELLNSKSNPNEGGLRQAHLFRFGKNNKITEYWDLSQQVQPGEMPYPANAF